MLTTGLVEIIPINLKGKAARWWAMLLQHFQKMFSGRGEQTATLEFQGCHIAMWHFTSWEGFQCSTFYH